MDVTAHATRSGDWWAVEVPQIPGLFTQAKRLDQVEALVVDAAAMLGHDDVRVDVVADLDADDRRAIDDARERGERLAKAEREAATASREAVERLRSRGLPVRDVARLMKISPQRVSQLAKVPQLPKVPQLAKVPQLPKVPQHVSELGKAQQRISDLGKAQRQLSKLGKTQATVKAPSDSKGSSAGKDA